MISLLNLVLFGIFFIIFWKLVNRKKGGKYPKGPLPLPFFGNVLSFSKLPHLTFNKWTEQYGKVYQVWIGSQRHIILSDLELIKKAYQHPSFTGRPKFDLMVGGNHGIVMTSGQEWQEQRRFTLRHLRDFGFGKNYMEALILEEVDELLNSLKSQDTKPLSINRRFTLAVINSLWCIITGKRFSHDDAKLEALFEQFILSGQNLNILLLMFLPGLVKLFPGPTGWTKFEAMMLSNQDLVMQIINEHRAEFSKDLEENPRDFVDAYLVEISKTQDTQSSFYGSFGEKSLVAVVVDMFQAGSLTTSTTLTWAVLYMVVHPEVQKKFQNEIDKVVGQNRLPSLADRPQMVYTEALINEVLRKSSIQPTGVFHAATEDASFEGYDIPKETLIVANQHFVHHDSKIWGDPENFRPERFLSSEGKIQKKEYLVPFSVGRRVCIGETLARDELFLFLTSLYQRFDVQADPSRPMPGTEPRRVFDTLEAPEFFITLKDRRD